MPAQPVELTEETPLFLHSAAFASEDEPHKAALVFDDTAEALYLPGRVKATLEAAAAKVFWDGFLWERLAFVAVRHGYGPSTALFALLTGVGAFTGVFLGQLLYASAVWAVAALSHAWQGNAIPTPRTLLFGLEFSVLLAAAAFVSGACWQPVVNLWVFVYGGPVTTPPGNRLFVGVLCGTWLLEGCIFFAALHFWRFVMSKLLRFEAIDAPFTVSTLVYDSSLSMSIGGAAGFFFASSGGGATNLLVRAFGVTPVMPVWRAAFYAGASNVTGFFVSQALQNALFPASTSWADLRKKGREQLNKTRSSVLLPYRTPFG